MFLSHNTKFHVKIVPGLEAGSELTVLVEGMRRIQHGTVDQYTIGGRTFEVGGRSKGHVIPIAAISFCQDS